ncbi:hypothetical protein HMPREF9372_0024 [Sporosarcina newyorkensis 2681]|uniref:YolD-like protein n=2 Tax=Caryophanaceae TaxID=186818 RepID=F9DMJ4_9BACL|nr:hypothetical protein HMPREF9372_0024 [Sporosarcina newyorkensis 2681]
MKLNKKRSSIVMVFFYIAFRIYVLYNHEHIYGFGRSNYMERNRDRGNIKWTSLMLPEHLERLRDWQREDQYTERPELTDWELQSMQLTLEHGWRSKCELLIKTWHDGEVRYHQGVIEALDSANSAILLGDPFGTERIPVADIIDVQLAKGADGV